MDLTSCVVVISLFIYTPLFGQVDSLRVRFIGNAAFALSDGVTTLVTDLPYQSGAFGYMTYDQSAIPAVPVTAVVTHGHADHFDAARLPNADWRVIGPPDVVTTVPSQQRVNGTRQWTIGAFLVRAYATPHSNVDHFSYLIEWQGRRFYFTGDTEDTAALVANRDLDVAFVTPWLWCATVRDGQPVSAERVVIHHQFPGRQSELCGTALVLAQGEELVFGSR